MTARVTLRPFDPSSDDDWASALRPGAVDVSRRTLKPSIGLQSELGILIRD